jgi:hypothetical protein
MEFKIDCMVISTSVARMCENEHTAVDTVLKLGKDQVNLLSPPAQIANAEYLDP